MRRRMRCLLAGKVVTNAGGFARGGYEGVLWSLSAREADITQGGGCLAPSGLRRHCVDCLCSEVSASMSQCCGDYHAEYLAFSWWFWHLLLTLPKRVIKWRRRNSAKEFWIEGHLRDTCTS